MSQNDGLIEEKLAEINVSDNCASADFVGKIMNKCAIYQQNRLENKAKIASLRAGITNDFGESTMREYAVMKQEHQETLTSQNVIGTVNDEQFEGQQEGK